MAIVVPIVSAWDPKGLDRAIKEIKKADGVFNKLSRTANIVSASMIQTGQTLSRNVTVPLVAFGVVVNNTITAASNLEEAQAKVTAVFGAQAAEVQKWSKTTSTAFGISSRQAMEAAGTYGNLFQAFGIGQTEAKDMSMRMVELAADMASFNNVGIDEALTALRSGLSGETEPLKRFGVALLDVRLRQEALNLGLGKYVGVLPPAIKAQAAYALILKDTALQQGDVARTAGGLANQKKFLAAQVEDLSGTFGAVLMPVMINFIGILRNSVLPQVQKFIEAFKTLSPQAIATAIKIALFAAALGPVMIIGGMVIKVIMGIGQAFVFLAKRIVLIPAAILFAVVAIVKANNATMSWGEATFKVVRGIVIGFVQIANAGVTIYNIMVKIENVFKWLSGSSVRLKEVASNFDYLIRGVDSAYSAYKTFSSALSAEQANLSIVAAEARALGDSLGDGGISSGGGGVAKGADLAAEAIANLKTKLESAKQTLTDARNRFDEFAKSIAGTVRSILNFGTAADAESGTFIENIVGQAEKAKAFGERIRKLIGMGLSESALREVLDAGADAGTKIADEIIAGGATVVDQVNTLLDATQSLANEIGLVGATQFYDAGIKQGEALVQGVVDAITAAGFVIDASGNITNPNAVSNAITTGGPTAGATGGAPTTTRSSTPVLTPSQQNALNKLKSMPMFANGGVVTRPTIGMVGEAGPEAIIPLNKLGKSGAVYNINVNAGIGTDGAQVGREIVDAIRRFERASGPVFASA